MKSKEEKLQEQICNTGTIKKERNYILFVYERVFRRGKTRESKPIYDRKYKCVIK